jgi:hypothetical protein
MRARRDGWIKAPPVVEVDIRGVWQEDEMPEEITGAPGYRPFTLSLEAQEWVDSMEEIVDGGDAVYGRPKPAQAVVHPSLSTPSSAPAPAAARVVPSSPPTPAPAPHVPRPLMPEIESAPPPRAVPPRPTMPDIDAAPPSRSPPKPRTMPDIGDEQPRPPSTHVLMPDIDATPARTPPHGGIAMPDIGTDRPARTLPRRVLMPDITGEEEPHRETMPDIG